MNVRRYVTIEAVATPGASAASYVPLVVVSRGLAFVRLLVVGKLLGEAGKAEFGLYQPAQELINWLVPVALFGVADVAERYAARFEKEGRLGWWLRGQYVRLLGTGVLIGAVMMVAWPWIAGRLLEVGAAERMRGMALVAGCAVTVMGLALYQHLSAVLRGLRAYGASAGMEICSAGLLLLFSAVAAWRGGAVSLVWAYAASVLIGFGFYGWRLRGFVRGHSAAVQAEGEAGAEADLERGHWWFGTWAFVRLMLMMTFGVISVVGVMHAPTVGGPVRGAAAHGVAADYAMPYRIAQLLAYVAATVWASSYGIAARAWTHGQVRRAEVQMLRVGKWGGVLLTLTAAGVLVLRGVLAAMEPAYAGAIMTLLPPLLGIFLWYGLLSFWSLYGDLHERSWMGAIFWGVAVGVQATVFGLGWGGPGAAEVMVQAGAWGVGSAVLVAVPLAFWRPVRFSATAVPLMGISLVPLSLFVPAWGVEVMALPVMLGVVGFLWVAGLLVRPVDRRAWRKRRISGERRAAVAQRA